MSKYTIVRISEDNTSSSGSKYGIDYIGLLRGKMTWSGEGNFCGYYAAEYFTDVTVVARYKTKNLGINQEPKEIYDIELVDYTYDSNFDERLGISSGLATTDIKAKDDKHALKLFEKHRQKDIKKLKKYNDDLDERKIKILKDIKHYE